jgi:hypothetical protein
MTLPDSVVRGVEAVDAQNRALAVRVSTLVGNVVGEITESVADRIRRQIYTVVAIYYGRDRNQSSGSAVYRAIVYAENLAAVDRYAEHVAGFREYIKGMGGESAYVIENAMRDQPDRFAELYFDFGGIPQRMEAAHRAGLLDPQRRWVQADGYALSDRVWRAGGGIRRAIDREIARAVKHGIGPETLARDLRVYLSPDYSPVRYMRDGTIVRIPGMPRGGGAGASAARRLARTEVQAIAHEATVLFVQDLPLTRKGVRWTLSPAHPRIDICDTYARNSSTGFPRGVYEPQSVPKIPHPHCLCALTPYVGTRQQVIDDLLATYGSAPRGQRRRAARTPG